MSASSKMPCSIISPSSWPNSAQASPTLARNFVCRLEKRRTSSTCFLQLELVLLYSFGSQDWKFHLCRCRSTWRLRSSLQSSSSQRRKRQPYNRASYLQGERPHPSSVCAGIKQPTYRYLRVWPRKFYPEKLEGTMPTIEEWEAKLGGKVNEWNWSSLTWPITI